MVMCAWNGGVNLYGQTLLIWYCSSAACRRPRILFFKYWRKFSCNVFSHWGVVPDEVFLNIRIFQWDQSSRMDPPSL